MQHKGKKSNARCALGRSSPVGRAYDNMAIWRDYAENVQGKGVLRPFTEESPIKHWPPC